jgi:hypothetical protein
MDTPLKHNLHKIIIKNVRIINGKFKTQTSTPLNIKLNSSTCSTKYDKNATILIQNMLN